MVIAIISTGQPFIYLFIDLFIYLYDLYVTML